MHQTVLGPVPSYRVGHREISLALIYQSIYPHLPPAFCSGRPGRDAHYSFPFLTSSPEKSFLSRHTPPKKRAAWRLHTLCSAGRCLIASQPVLFSQRLGFLPLAHLAQVGDQAFGRTTRPLMLHAVEQHEPLQLLHILSPIGA
eukprot:scaffold82282_cov63-Phaeocystis_antarctica.AAC.2